MVANMELTLSFLFLNRSFLAADSCYDMKLRTQNPSPSIYQSRDLVWEAPSLFGFCRQDVALPLINPARLEISFHTVARFLFPSPQIPCLRTFVPPQRVGLHPWLLHSIESFFVPRPFFLLGRDFSQYSLFPAPPVSNKGLRNRRVLRNFTMSG